MSGQPRETNGKWDKSKGLGTESQNNERKLKEHKSKKVLKLEARTLKANPCVKGQGKQSEEV